MTIPVTPGAPHRSASTGSASATAATDSSGARTVRATRSAPSTPRPEGPAALVLHGWAIDPDTVNAVPIHVYVDGVGAAIGTANVARGDVERVMPGYGAGARLRASAVPVTGDHTRVRRTRSARAASRNITLGCTRVSGAPRGALDTVGRPNGGGTLRVRGWAFDPDTAGPINVHVYVDGVGRGIHDREPEPARHRRASSRVGDRPTASTSRSAGSPPGQHQVCVYGISVGGGSNTTLGCKHRRRSAALAPRRRARRRSLPRRSGARARLTRPAGLAHQRLHVAVARPGGRRRAARRDPPRGPRLIDGIAAAMSGSTRSGARRGARQNSISGCSTSRPPVLVGQPRRTPRGTTRRARRRRAAGTARPRARRRRPAAR